MRKIVELVLLKSEEDYRKEYEYIYSNKIFNLYDIPVFFSDKDFNHIFYEPNSGGTEYKFSFRRAKRLNFMKEILSGEIDIEIMFQPDRETFALFCEDLECVMYLRIRPNSGMLQVGTFFDFGKDHKKMLNKQKKKCVPIALNEIKDKLSK